MSGEYCYGCGCGGYVRIDSGYECDLCGHRIAKLRGMSMWHSEEGQRACSEMIAQKKRGELFFVRVLFESAESRDKQVFEMMDVLGVSGADTSSTEVVMRVSVRPSQAQVDRVRAMEGVVSVRVV